MSNPQPKRADDFDWSAIRGALQHAQAAAIDRVGLSPEQAKAVLDARAEALGRRPTPVAASGTFLDVVRFGLGKERYAIETRYVREVIQLAHLTPVPGTPTFFAGVTNLRGNVTAVVDLRSFFDVAAKALIDFACVIVLGDTRSEFGILADEIYGQGELNCGELSDPHDALPEGGRDLVKGVTKSVEILLDGAALLDDPRLTFGN
jgi:purine-binding chemotaxis protein CheW